MITEAQIEKTITELFSNIKFTAEPAGLYDPLRYMIEIGGKRVRPRLCLLTYALFKDELNDDILAPASALEVFHSFTLIHDDIMDNAEVRRGVPTVYKKWSPNTAILSGDVMLIEAYKLIQHAPEHALRKAIDLFSKTAAEVCEGQQFDMEFENRENVSIEEYMKMIGLKTAVLIACASKMGAIIAGASEKECQALYNYGYKLGLAFQIADDWLDTYADPKVFGKAIGGDILNNKKSWLITKAFEEDTLGQMKEAMNMPIETKEQKAEKIARVKEIYARLSISEQAQEEIARLTKEAQEQVEYLGLGKIKTEYLHRYADTLLGRRK